jgi:hypothetical protein
MVPIIPLEIQDLIIDEIAVSKDRETLLSCQLVSPSFHLRSSHQLFALITINRVHSPDIGDRLALLRDIMIGKGSLPGITTHIKKFTINAREPCNTHPAHQELTEAFFGKFELCQILRLLRAQENSCLRYLSLLLNQGFEWTSLHCAFEYTFSSLLSQAPNIRVVRLEGLSGIPSTFILGKNIQRLFLLESFMKEDGAGWTLTPPPLEYLHIHDRFPVCILSRGPRSVGPKMNIADLSVSVCTPDGYSTVENIGKLGSGVIGDVERLILRFDGELPTRIPFIRVFNFNLIVVINNSKGTTTVPHRPI